VTAGTSRRELATAAHAAMCAMLFATRPETWPAFAAWAEQHVPGESWGEADRLALAGNAATLARLARHLDDAEGTT
jgi:hypothetical protein